MWDWMQHCSARSAAWTRATLQPAAGAHGRVHRASCIIRAYHPDRGEAHRDRSSCPTPRTAPTRHRGPLRLQDRHHPVQRRGRVDLSALKALRSNERRRASCSPTRTRWASSKTRSPEIARMSTTRAGCSTCDGANMNAILGHHAPRRHGLRRDALQPAQDVHHAARRRRARLRARWR